MKQRLALLATTATVALSLSACGGGSSPSSASGGSSGTPPQPAVDSSVAGVVATGRPVAQATVTAYGIDGKTCGTAQTGADGSYAMNTQCPAGPVTFDVTAGSPGGLPLAAIGLPNTPAGAVSGTVNLTPLSTLALYDFVATQTVVPTAQVEPDFAHVLAAVPTIAQAATLIGPGAQGFEAQVLAAAHAVVQAIAAQLQAAGVDASTFDPVGTPFAANGQGVDAVFDQNPAGVPSADGYQLGSLLSLQLPAQPGAAPVYGGQNGPQLASSGGAAGTPPSSGGGAGGATGNLSIGGFTGVLAGSSCQVTATGGQIGGSCTLAGKAYPVYGTLASNALGFSILTVRLQAAPNFFIAGAVSSSGGSSQGAWADPMGEIVAAGASGHVTITATAN